MTRILKARRKVRQVPTLEGEDDMFVELALAAALLGQPSATAQDTTVPACVVNADPTVSDKYTTTPCFVANPDGSVSVVGEESPTPAASKSVTPSDAVPSGGWEFDPPTFVGGFMLGALVTVACFVITR